MCSVYNNIIQVIKLRLKIDNLGIIGAYTMICMSAFAELTNYLYGIWRYGMTCFICEKSQQYVEKPTDVGMSD